MNWVYAHLALSSWVKIPCDLRIYNPSLSVLPNLTQKPIHFLSAIFFSNSLSPTVFNTLSSLMRHCPPKAGIWEVPGFTYVNSLVIYLWLTASIADLKWVPGVFLKGSSTAITSKPSPSLQAREKQSQPTSWNETLSSKKVWDCSACTLLHHFSVFLPLLHMLA